MIRILWLLFLTGILFGAGPCMASCGPVLVSYIISTGKNKRKSVLTYALFSFSRITAYLALSVLVYTLGNFTVTRIAYDWLRYVRFAAGAFIVCIGIVLLLGKNSLFFPVRCIYRSFIEKDKKSMCILGFAIGLLPCAPLLALFSYIGLVAHSTGQSVLYGLAFGIGTLLSPLLLLVFISGALNQYLLSNESRIRKIFDLACGCVIVFLGMYLLLRS